MKTAAYLERLKHLAPRPTVYAVAQLLELPEKHVRSWYLGKSRPDTFSCVRIAELLALDPLQVIADVEAEREKDEVKRARWMELSRRLGRAAVLILTCGLASLYPNDGHSAISRPSSCYSDSVGINNLQIMRHCVQRLCRRLEHFLTLRYGRFLAFGY